MSVCFLLNTLSSSVVVVVVCVCLSVFCLIYVSGSRKRDLMAHVRVELKEQELLHILEHSIYLRTHKRIFPT